jgi:phage I-like protein
MNATILNREFQHPTDGWYQIEPKGEHLNKAAGIVQVIDDVALKSIVEKFQEESAPPGFPGLLVDREHFKHDLDKESRAEGWLQELQARPDGLYAKINWTATGQKDVDGADYRFFSTEYDEADCEVLGTESDGVKRVRPLRLDGLTLTNMPNNRGMKPITNSSRERVLSTQRHIPQDAHLQAGAQFGRIVNRIQKESGCTFDSAWNRARELEPTLFAAMGSNRKQSMATGAKQTDTFKNREIQSAADRIKRLTQAACQAYGISFSEAWDTIRKQLPDTFSKMSGQIQNRGEGAPETVTESDWKSAQKKASDVMERMQSDLTDPVDRGTTVVNDDALRGTFQRYFLRLQNDEGMTPQQAFDHIKDTEPVFWTRVVNDYDCED